MLVLLFVLLDICRIMGYALPMATIKDIAREAGVSQGTVSNVLNGKGNVSSSKILKVEEAARALGYTANEKAKLLRKGSSKTLALILPNPHDRQYNDFLVSFTVFAESQGCDVALYYSEDDSELERSLIESIKSTMAIGIATYTTLGKQAVAIYQECGFEPWQVLFVERHGGGSYLGFDYQSAAFSVAEYLHVDSVTLVSEEQASQDELFCQALSSKVTTIRHVRTNSFSRKSKLFGVYEEEGESIIVTTSLALARMCKSIQTSFFPERESTLVTLAPLTTLPEQEFIKYELNYRYLGRVAAERLLLSLKTKKTETHILKNDGFRSWKKPRRGGCSLRMLLLDTPHSFAMEHFAQMYGRQSKISIKVEIASYESINEVLEREDLAKEYDILRIGADVFSWDAPQILKPLDEISCSVDTVFSHLIDGVERPFSQVQGKRYAIPFSPSLQVLYYRKDLFEKPMYKRLYQETYHENLEIPTTFAQYNRIASFFTQALNPDSPVPYGSTLLLGKTPIVAGTEFMTRYFSYAPSMFSDGLPLLNTPEAEQALSDVLAMREVIKEPLQWWSQAAEEFSNGTTAMTILFSNFASEFFSKHSQVPDKVGYTMIPGSRPLLGGGSLGITKASKHPEEALHFLSWLASDPVASAVSLLGGNLVTKATLTNYEVIETYPWMEMLSTGFHQALGQRTPSLDNAPFHDHKFMHLLGRAVWACWYDNTPIKQALKSAHQSYCREQELYTR